MLFLRILTQAINSFLRNVGGTFNETFPPFFSFDCRNNEMKSNVFLHHETQYSDISPNFHQKNFAFDKTIIQHSKYSRTFTRGEIFSLTQNQCDVCVKKKIDVTFASKWKSMWRLRQNENRCDVCVKMKINVTFASKWKSMWHLRQKEFPMTRSTNVRI
jgi:hypothetical protein